MSGAAKLPGDRGASAWSAATRRKLVAMVLEKALAGDVRAADVVLRYHFDYGDAAPFAAASPSNVVEAPL
jgi:hypothetical protein